MTLQEKLYEFKKQFETGKPAEIISTMHRATEELRQSGIMDRVLKIGDRAPQFSLRNVDGGLVTLNNLIAKGNLIVTFYRGHW